MGLISAVAGFVPHEASHRPMPRLARQTTVGAVLAGCLASCLAGMLMATPAIAQTPGAALELTQARAVRGDDGVWFSFDVQLHMPAAVEEALRKGVPLYFVADATLVRYRWYWRDETVAHVERTWRLSYQPLTQEWRVRIGVLSQSFDSLNSAVRVMTRGVGWKLAEAQDVRHAEDYHVEFQYRLDTDELPRPLQIGLHDEADWNLAVQRQVPVQTVAGVAVP